MDIPDRKIKHNKKVKPFRINISSVSGRYFTNQIALKCNMNDAREILCKKLYGGYRSCEDYKPNICFGSSGGNISEYMDMAADYSTERLLSIFEKLNSEIFIKTWIPEGLEFIPNWLIGLTKNSLFRKGYGPHYIFQSVFDFNTIKKTEIITGTYDVESCRSQYFSNMSYSESWIDANIYNLDKQIYDCMPLKFLNGNIYEIGNAAFASASVPLVTENHKVLDKYYSDGGVTYDSPIAAFKPEIIRIINGNYISKSETKNTKETKENREKTKEENRESNTKEENRETKEKTKEETKEENKETKENRESDEIIKSYVLDGDDVRECDINSRESKALRMVYFACYQLDTHHNTCGPNIKNQFTEIFRQQRHILAIHDKNAALDILYRVIGDQTKVVNENIFNMNVQDLAKKLEFLETRMHYLIILYPHGYVYIEENDFVGSDLLKYVDITRKNFGIDIYYSVDSIE